jgi:hypothetical protein
MHTSVTDMSPLHSSAIARSTRLAGSSRTARGGVAADQPANAFRAAVTASLASLREASAGWNGLKFSTRVGLPEPTGEQ